MRSGGYWNGLVGLVVGLILAGVLVPLVGQTDPNCVTAAKPTATAPAAVTMTAGGYFITQAPPLDAAVSLPLLGSTAPPFTAETTQGPIRFPQDFHGRWVILFSHPADFTPVCTTEFMSFATLKPKFDALGCDLLGLSIDSNQSHIAWLRTIRERIKFRGMEKVNVVFPVIADLKMDVARKYGMIHPDTSDSRAVRAVFFIDPKAKVRAILYYPMSTGRNFQEILRLLIAMQTSDAQGCSTPADWQPGEDVIVPPPGTCGAADVRVQSPDADMTVVDWFLTFRKLPKEKLTLPPEK